VALYRGEDRVDDRSASAVRELDDFGVAASLDASGAEPLFVINLCAAMTPQSLDIGVPGLDRFKLYQVSRMEDGRRRYRLRLGFFTTEADAEEVLVSVRSRFATAFTACLCDEDLKHASGYLKRSIQDLARTGRFKIPTALKTEDKSRKPEVRPAEIQKESKAPIKPVLKDTGSSSVTVLETPKTLAKEIAREALQKLAPTPPPAAKLVEAKKPAEKMPAANVEAKQPAKSPNKTELAAQQIRAQINSLDDTGAGFEINWVPEALDASPSTPVGSSIPRATPAAVPPVSVAAINAPKANAKETNNKLVASAKSAPTPPPAINVSAAKTAASQLSLEKVSAPVPATPAKPVAGPTAPFHVGAGVKIPDIGLSLTKENSSIPAGKSPSVAPAPNVTAPVSKPSTPPAPSAPRPAAPAGVIAAMPRPVSGWRNGGDDVPTLDTTQTIRDLTQSELNDVQGLKWFVVQLALSDQPVNLDTMPKLDIFEAYRLYSVALLQNGRINHALRLGFFSEQVSAEAVLGYLKTFFAAPVVERISVAEHKRFSEEPRLKAPEGADKANARVITLEEKRTAPPTTLSELRSQTVAQVAAQSAKPPKPAKSVPTIHEAVASTPIVPTSTTMYRTSGKYAAPAVKRSAGTITANTPKKINKTASSSPQQDLLEEARAMGLSDTQILRVQKNPSLLSRLVGKLTK